MTRILTVFSLIALLLVGGCAEPMSKTQKGAIYGALGGAAAGALVGQATGKNTKSTLLGAGIGAAAGAGIGAGVGAYMDKKEREVREALAAVEGVNIVRDANVLFITFRSDNQFAVGSYVFNAQAQNDVARLAAIFREDDKNTILVSGHTDSTGSEDINQTLSEKRANAIRNIFVANGVAAERVSTVGLGESQPVASNATEAGRRLNRRVEIRVTPK